MEMREGKVKCLSAAGFHHMAYVEGLTNAT
jgi:hypothetical protein